SAGKSTWSARSSGSPVRALFTASARASRPSASECSGFSLINTMRARLMCASLSLRADLEAIGLEELAGNRGLVHLVGAVEDATRALVAEEPRQRRVIGHAQRAVDLDGAVEDALHRVG